MIASRFRVVGWVAGVVAALLLCYLASQSVAGERASLAKVDRQIADAKADIQRLTMEIGTRSRMGQLEHWNAEAFALQAPAPRQFVANEVQLVNLVVGKTSPLDTVASPAQMVSYRPDPQPSAPAPVIAAPPAPVVPTLREQPLLRVASYVKPKPSRLGDDEAVPLVRTSLDKLAADTLRLDDDAAPRPAKASKAKKARVTNLLPDDFGALVADERTPKRRP